MAIGTTLKVGFDAGEVRRGFGMLPRLFSGTMRGMRQIGIGAARQIGAGMTDLIGRAIMAIPEGIKETMDWAGNLTDMSAQTGMSVSQLVLLEEALRLAGASANDTSRIISTLKDNLYEATQEAGPARDALHQLGFRASEFRGMRVDEAFQKIGMRVSNLGPEFEGLETVMADLFGARMGYRLIRFFRDFHGGMAAAENNVGDFARRLDATAGGYDKLSDALGRAKMRWRELMSVVIDQGTRLFGDDFVDQAFDFLAPEKIRNTLAFLTESIAGFFKDGGFKALFNDLGRSIGEGLRESLRDLMPSNPFKGFFGGPQASAGRPDRTTAQLLDINRQQAKSLRNLEKSGFPAIAT